MFCALVVMSTHQVQYIFIHDALLEAFTCGDSEIPVGDLVQYIQNLESAQDGTPNYEKEFKVGG